MAEIKLTTPIAREKIESLHSGDYVFINGVIVTARDAGHKYLVDNFVKADNAAEKPTLVELRKHLTRGLIYHCGPIVRHNAQGEWEFVSAGPTTSAREELYEYDVMGLLDLAGVIGKGGMGPKTLDGCHKFGSVYFHAIGGAGALIAQNVTRVIDMIKPEFGTPEAFWVVEVKDFPCLVTMDTYGVSLHAKVAADSLERFKKIVG